MRLNPVARHRVAQHRVAGEIARGRQSLTRALAAMALSLLLAACGDGGPRLPPLADDAVILAFGDSLTEGTGASREQSYPAVLANLIDRSVVNAGIAGEESDAGLARLPGLLTEVRPALVILGHGGNDLLRRRDLQQSKANLQRMVEQAQASGASVVLLGIPKPGLFLGTHPLYQELADELGLPLEDRALAAILSDRNLKSDEIHPNAAGYAQLAAALQRRLQRAGAVF